MKKRYYLYALATAMAIPLTLGMKTVNADAADASSTSSTVNLSATASSQQATDQAVPVSETTAIADPSTVVIHRTSESGEHDVVLPSTSTHTVDSSQQVTGNYVQVLPNDKKQTMEGVGGALTESAVSNIDATTPENQKAIWDAYYGKDGAAYTNARVTVGSADFSLTNYDYDTMPDGEADPNLDNFSIDHDKAQIIPAIKTAQSYDPDLKIFAAPWAPPAWMKISGDRYGGRIVTPNGLKPEYYDAYAKYLVKYLQAYEEQGIHIDNLSVQNEATSNTPIPNMTWTAEQTADFIANYLGPEMDKAGIKDTQIMIWDLIKGEHMNQFTDTVLSNPEAAKYVSGVGLHWYDADKTAKVYLGYLFGQPGWDEAFDSIDTFKQAHPDQNVWATEASQERGTWINSWTPAARYSHDILNDFDNGAQNFIDWNIVLNQDGGPTQGITENACAAPVNIIFDKNGDHSKDRVIFNPSYYILKRVSQSAQPGTVTLGSKTNVDGLDKVAIMQNDGSIALLVGNNTDKDITFTILNGNQAVDAIAKANSMTTYDMPAAADTTTTSVVEPTEKSKLQQTIETVNTEWVQPIVAAVNPANFQSNLAAAKVFIKSVLPLITRF